MIDFYFVFHFELGDINWCFLMQNICDVPRQESQICSNSYLSSKSLIYGIRKSSLFGCKLGIKTIKNSKNLKSSKRCVGWGGDGVVGWANSTSQIPSHGMLLLTLCIIADQSDPSGLIKMSRQTNFLYIEIGANCWC